MLRTWNYAWWRPVVGLLVVAFGMLIVAPLVLMPVLAAGVAVEGGAFLPKFEKAATLQTVDPAALLYLNLVLGSMVLITWFVMRVLHRMRPRWLASVMPRMRWKFLFACLGLAVVALVAQVVVGAALPGNDQGIGGHLNDFTSTTVALAAIVLFTTPLQAAGEEYVFRGYLQQAFGALFRSKWAAIVISATLFATLVVSVLVPTSGAEGTEMGGQLNDFTTTTRDFLLVVLLLTPLQAAGEEYVFRGYLTQAFGGLFKGPWVAVVGPALLFALAHGGQSAPVFFDRFAFGLVAGVLVIRTGGLEAGLAMHVLNNWLAFSLALAFGDMGSALSPSGGSWWSIPVTLTQALVYLGLVLLAARHRGLRTTTERAVLVAPVGRV
jgi:membrane protease YdiL (CAAX protease family)